ncbi:PHP domain-containing protein [Aeromicrobium chenweiae]|uniref:Phosphatase n=1 Tax=Aeromicrobium chenweiae TaxID=2079793 RepID=A0A2S0WP99_9ACTN|nr:PHP domain-containing protein [Aeromicrobium chenweiae]AWB93173.1 phosphatase [Aeromicrobium chenweiae]TGN34163.1 PHP domain-containing protein [Aeromicrobium chenweiae]
MRIDLHTHSNRSDGTDSPAELVANAKAAGLDVVALTDHDATTGWDDAVEAGESIGLHVVRGIEVSTWFHGESVHLLGYEFDPTDVPLLAELDRVLGGREQRLPQMLARLAEHGIDITMADVAAQSVDAAASGRPHIADAMVAKGYIAHRDEAFRGWLNSGGKAHVERYAAPLIEAVRLLKAAGGKAVVAHPWSRGSDKVLTADAFETLAEAGLDGIEVDHNDHDEEARRGLRRIAADLDLVTTGSSDYHGTGKSEAFHLGAHTTDPEEYGKLLG